MDRAQQQAIANGVLTRIPTVAASLLIAALIALALSGLFFVYSYWSDELILVVGSHQSFQKMFAFILSDVHRCRGCRQR